MWPCRLCIIAQLWVTLWWFMDSRRDEAGADTRRRAPPAQRPQQPGQEFAPADVTTRTPDEALQVVSTGTALPLASRPDQQPLPSPPRPPPRQRVPCRKDAGI